VENPRFVEKVEKRVKKLQKQLSKKKDRTIGKRRY